ncbi:sugar transferase [Auraticoccus monumenti]|uniref:sugar transferase n=1 Tax=Auraticoccus monumenti TaxID=675864 RepID=UPI0012F74C2F|nr:sugar transferase [Auraticoccus monumenti]
MLFRESESTGSLLVHTPPEPVTTGTSPSGLRPDRRRPDWSARYAAWLLSADALCGLAAWGLALTVTQLIGLGVAHPWWWAVACGLLWVVLIGSGRGYERSRLGLGSDEVRAVLHAGSRAVAVAAVVAALLQDTALLTVMVLAALLALLGGVLVRLALRRWLHARQRNGLDLRDTVVVGSLPQVTELADQLTGEPGAGMRVVGVCVPDHEIVEARASGLTVLGGTEDVRSAVLRHGVRVVAVASGQPPHYLRELAWSIEGLDTQLLVHPGLVEVAGPRMHIRPFIGLPLLAIEQPHFSGWRISAKRVTDLVLSSLGVLVASPLLLVLTLAIRLSDGGSAIFKQTRVGHQGRTFTMYKFRSMHVDAEARLAELMAQNEGAGPLFKMVDDPRITRVGKFLRRTSLDELPQLFNILNGTMSLVGPRPPLPSEVEAYQRPVRRRLLVVPGLTGLWQVSGRSSLSWDESVRLDLRYVENWTLALDLLIIWRTFWAVLARRGAY